MTVFSNRDFDQHEQVIFGSDPATGLQAIIAVHNTHLGPALGGCRMYPYANEASALSDVLRLSRGMTYKSALAQLPLGGGKSVIIGDPVRGKSTALFREMGRLVERLSGHYIIAQDSGTTVQDLQAIATSTSHVAGTQEVLDDQGKTRSGDPSPATAYGVFTGIKAAVKHRFNNDDLRDLRVAIQGVGNVGFGVAAHLHKVGAKLFVTDINQLNMTRAVKEFGATAVSGDEIYRLPADVFVPCALGGAINERTLDVLQVQIIAGAANNQLASSEHGRVLHERGILYAPDFVINAGGIIHVYYMRNQRPWSESVQHVEEIGNTLGEIFRRSQRYGVPPVEIANQLAEERFKPKRAGVLDQREAG